MTEQQKINHLLWRAGFGPSVNYTPAETARKELENIFRNAKNITLLDLPDWNELTRMEARGLSEMERAEFRKKEREARINISGEIIDRYKESTAFLREKMTLFWMGLFACRIPHPPFAVDYYNVILKNSLSDFKSLLTAMTRNGALLQYLNNNQNRKLSPNENFARELMELFTLGRGKYSESDVREGARAFTGWAFNKQGEFIIRHEHHDTGSKTFLGETGNFDADDVVRIILSKKECARYITSKIYKFFVNENVNDDLLKKWSDEFYASGYNIEKLMRTIFSSDAFYNPENAGAKIKSPIELLTGISRQFNIKFENPQARLQLQKILGQTLFDPPNVAGWPGGRNWIDSSTMMYRTRLPSVLLENAETLIAPREEFDVKEMTMDNDQKKIRPRVIKTTYDGTAFTKKFNTSANQDQTQTIGLYLLQVNLDVTKKNLVNSFVSSSSGNTKILKIAIYIMSLPEYQLC